MTVEEFLQKRTPIYINPQTGILTVVNSASIRDLDFARIFFDLKIHWLNATRGYVMDKHAILYVNDYEIPAFAIDCIVYIFNYLPDIEWIGLGCNKGKPGEIWKPKLVIRRNDADLLGE